MRSKNLHYLFYKEYYCGLDLKDPKSKRNTQLLSEKNEQILSYIPVAPFIPSKDPLKHVDGYQCIDDIQTLYPGLLIGTGYPHSVGAAEEYQMGCTLHYVTGLPYVPGSGVKGALRAAFRDEELVCSLLAQLGISETFDYSALVNSIFGADKIAGKDVFLDAYPIYEKGKRLLASDALAPHGDDPLKNPIPLPMLKISSGVRFCFRFILTDYSEKITAAVKIDLFRALLRFFGVGAKTNSGYGRFEYVPKPEPEEELPQDICPFCKINQRKINNKTGKYYEMCNDCRTKQEKAAQKEAKQQAFGPKKQKGYRK